MPIMLTTARIIMMLGAAALLEGCASRTYDYTVSVHNASSKPVMVGLAKEGAPFEDTWARPEDIANDIAARGPTPGVWEWGVPVQPGQTGDVGQVRARLDRGAQAYIRVYSGAKSLDDFLAISRGSPNRLDIHLEPGDNHFTITDADGRLQVSRKR